MASEGQDRADALGWGMGVTPTDLRPSPAPPSTPPYHKKLQMFLFTTKGRRSELLTMIEAGAPSTEEATLAHRVGARPTGDRYVRTTDAPAQRIKGAKLKAAPARSKGAARGIIK